jgi:hypothetical protein
MIVVVAAAGGALSMRRDAVVGVAAVMMTDVKIAVLNYVLYVCRYAITITFRLLR